MLRIEPIEKDAAPEHVQRLLQTVQASLGGVPNMFRTAARSVPALEAMLALFGAAAKTGLGAELTERIALVIAERNGCEYCLAAHTALGRKAGLNVEQIRRARFGQADDARSQAALDFAAAVSDRRGQIADTDVARMRMQGFTDAEIIDIVLIVILNTFTNYVNNVAQTEIDFPKVPALAA